MKRHLYSIAATFAALALCSCASYEEEAGTIGNGNPETDGIHSFRAEMATSDSRAGIDGSNSVWEEGDDLSIVKFANGQTAPELVRAAVRKGSLSADGRSAIFDCESPIDPEAEQYAVYPYLPTATGDDFAAGSEGARTFAVALPNQTWDESGFRYPILLGQWSRDNDRFSFRNPLTVLNITLKKPASVNGELHLGNIVVRGNDNEKMWGAAEIAMPGGTLGFTADALDAAMLDCGNAEITAEGTEFCICIAPQNYRKGLTFAFVTDAGTMIATVKESGLDYSAKANHVIALPPIEFTRDTSGISTAVVRATDTTIAVGWTVTPSNVQYLAEMMPNSAYDYTTDIAKRYKIELYEDIDCKNMVVGWTVNDSSNSTNLAKYKKDYPPRFIFTDLKPQTTYYLIVRNLTDNVSMQYPAAVATTAPAFTGQIVVSNPSVGDVILFENFDKNLWGGDLPARAPGYSRTDRSKATELYTARGDNPDQTDSNYYTSEAGTEIGLFNTLKGVVPAMGLDEWGWIADDNKTGCILSRAGYLKIGASSKHASLITPQLGALAGKAAVRVTFKACPYGATTIADAEKAVAVKVFNDTSIDAASHRITKYTEGDIATLTLEGDQCTWKEYSVVLEEVEPTSRIAFCGNRAGTGVQSRFHIDDIRISVESVSDNLRICTGHIKDTAGQPVAGVCVTDGFNIVKTDAGGAYSIGINEDAEFIYYTVPAEYEVNYNDKGYPSFYTPIVASTDVYDFTLSPLAGGKQTEWTLCCMADPQVKNRLCVDRFLNETAKDLKSTLPSRKNVYGIALGDILWNSNATMWADMYSAMSYANTGAHFFAVMGNHDWYSSDTDSAPSDARFKGYFGPTRFSFDRGDVHVLGMNNVIANGTGGGCSGGFTRQEYSWLTKDLANVDKNKCVVLCCHIPFRTGKAGTYHSEYYNETLNLLSQFAKAYILIGHSHYNYHYFHTKNGKEIREIIHTAACGLFWQVKCCGDGSPSGYGLYEFNGADIANFVMKHCEYDADYQIRAYDGSERIAGQYVNPYSWDYEKGYIVANVFNADKNWKVELYQNGTFVCNMAAITGSDTRTPTSMNISSTSAATIGNNRDWWLWYQTVDPHWDKTCRDGLGWRGRPTDNSYQKTSAHLYKGKLRTVPTDMSAADFEVRATDPYGNVYKCTKLTSYTEREAWR